VNTKKTTLLSIGVAIGLSVSVYSCAQEEAATQAQAQATFINAQNKEIGTAVLTETPHGVLIEFIVNEIPQGEHGFHIHETGSCETPDFKSAGGHYMPRGKAHGYESADGYHAGDMPNQFVEADGLMRGQVFNPQVTLAEGEATLFDDDGSALMIHADADDYSSQPAGAAGARLACAVINKQ
jgi:Cu-Zn family superoxide dismutase